MNFKRVVYIVSIILLVIVGACYIEETYSRFTNTGSIKGDMDVARWNVTLKKDDDVTELEKAFNMTFTATGTNDGNVGQNKFAPGVSGKASLILDLTDTEVSVDYNITVDKQALINQIGSSNITLTISDNNKPIDFGKDEYIPLVNGEKFTSENGILTFNFDLAWDNDDTAEKSFSDTNLTLSYEALTLPISVKIRQHIDDEIENKKVTTNISYIESTEVKKREESASDRYYFEEQDVLNVNPEKGFYNSSTLNLNENGFASGAVTESRITNLLHLKVDLSAFSGSMNVTGQDKELTDAAIAALEKRLELIKQNNNTVILRFVYDNGASGIIPGVEKVEPGQEMLLRHIEQLSATFKKYASTINVIQTGFYGLWGEAYYNTDATRHPEYYEQTIQALLNATAGTDITIAVRTPEYYTWYKGIEIGDINNENNITTSSDDAYRVGVFNDGYGGSEDDLGTYKDREKEIEWLKNQTSHTFFGGEAIPDTVSPDAVNGIGKYNTAMNFIEEAFKLHTSYINWEWNQALHEQWANQIYTGDDPYYYGKSALTYIENHLGYRFVVKEVRTYDVAESNSTLPIDISINNVGFANVIKNKRADIIITDASGNAIKTYEGVNIDAKDFLSQTTIRKSINVELPELASGEYKIYLRLSSGETLKDNSYYSAIRFANTNMYDETLQANFISQFTVK